MNPVRLGPYENLVAFGALPDLFLGDDRRFNTPVRALIKVCELREPPPTSVLAEASLLRKLRCAHIPSLLDLGYDEKVGFAYYGMLVPGGDWILLTSLAEDQQMTYVPAVVQALAAAHACGIVYRNFTAAAFAVDEAKVWLYDVRRAARIDATGKTRGIDRLEPFDPPEAAGVEYEGVLGDIYSLGFLLKGVAPNRPVLGVVPGMTNADPALRPQSMREVELRLKDAGIAL